MRKFIGMDLRTDVRKQQLDPELWKWLPREVVNKIIKEHFVSKKQCVVRHLYAYRSVKPDLPQLIHTKVYDFPYGTHCYETSIDGTNNSRKQFGRILQQCVKLDHSLDSTVGPVYRCSYCGFTIVIVLWILE